MRLLVIEDATDLASAIADFLSEEDCLCEVVHSYSDAVHKIENFHYDCFLVDLTLPKGDGLNLVRRIKKMDVEAGVLIISARNAVGDKIKGLEAGADDFLAKPFHLSELNARIRATMRRRLRVRRETVIHFNEISICEDQRVVQISGKNISLTKSEFRLLNFFIINKHRVLLKEHIASHLLNDVSMSIVSYDFIYSHIKNLRKKLILNGAKDYVQAVYGLGYKFSDK
ncbi:MAG: response regulator transcription factor [Saprospiraceae bacterium]|nr:response regulator transcription factor [Saprospiraceae bacterium]